MGWMLETVGRSVARYLDRPAAGYEPFTPSDAASLQATIRTGDVLLVEGNSHISGVIKYLTQSTWSHAALYVGPLPTAAKGAAEGNSLVEASLEGGVAAVPLAKYFQFHTRICRPVNLSTADCETVCRYAIDRIGDKYDLKNIIDLVRYLIPLPVPQRWRRRMIALGSGDPTKLICSGIIAQAFQSVRYPILPKITLVESGSARQEIMQIRHSSLFVPRDFDISPYFAVVKPSIDRGFDYRALHWTDLAMGAESSSIRARGMG
jgi:Permuted papain-like amidase enzyme, YaeF/YiiX, C92 family